MWEKKHIRLSKRALRICSPGFTENELNHSYEIFRQLKYPRLFFRKSSGKARKSFSRRDTAANFDKNNLLVLPYCNNFVQCPKQLKPLNVNVAFRNTSNIKHVSKIFSKYS